MSPAIRMNPSRVAVIGGSIAGLSAAIALRCVGCAVDVYESSAQRLRGRGGGLVVQHEMLEWMAAHDIATIQTLSVPGIERQFLDRAGRVINRFPDSTPFTSWEAVYDQLRAAFPVEQYHLGRRCESVTQTATSVVARLSDGSAAEADLLIGADGVGSTVRGQLMPETKSTYAGYVAWRGVYPESQAPAHVRDALAQRFTLFQGADFHLLTYLIPGENGELDEGSRRMNWVWYRNVDEEELLPNLLTDVEGKRHRSSVPAGKVSPRYVAIMLKDAGEQLPPLLADLVRSTPSPFIQVIFDLRVPRMYEGRCVLIGDAACVVRPHTASGTSKASGDSVALAQHLQAVGFDLSQALPRWQQERLAVADRLLAYGLRLARESGLGGASE